jgi:hypothetical protein
VHDRPVKTQRVSKFRQFPSESGWPPKKAHRRSSGRGATTLGIDIRSHHLVQPAHRRAVAGMPERLQLVIPLLAKQAFELVLER